MNVSAKLPQDDRYSDWYDRDRDGVDDGPSEHSQIDFILVSRRLWERVAYVTIDHGSPAAQVSDHWPVVLDLSLGSGMEGPLADAGLPFGLRRRPRSPRRDRGVPAVKIRHLASS